MPKTIDKSVIERMVLAKRLFQQGDAACANQLDLFEFSKGLLSLQDAVELSLGAIASVVKAKLKDPMAFAGYFAAINKELEQDKKLPYERELSQLNKARVSVKHYGILQRPSDHAQAIGAVKPFLEYASKTFLERDFDKLSLADMIPDEEIRTWVKNAELELEKGTPESWRECVETLAKVKYVLFDHEFDRPKGLAGLAYSVAPPQAQEIKMLQFGLDVLEFQELSLILPFVHWDRKEGSPLEIEWAGAYCHEGNWTKESLQRALESIIDMAIKIKAAHPATGLVPASDYFEYQIAPVNDEALFISDPTGVRIVTVKFLSGGIGTGVNEADNHKVVFRLPKDKILTCSLASHWDGAYYEVSSPEILDGKKPAYVLKTDVRVVERYPKKSTPAKTNE